MSNKFEGAVKPSSIEQDAYETDLMAHRQTEIPSNMQARWVYDGNGNCTYAAFAPKGLSESSNGWLIQQFTIVGGYTTKRLIAYDSFANYLTASYS